MVFLYTYSQQKQYQTTSANRPTNAKSEDRIL